MAPTGPSPAADVTRLPGPEPGDPAIAPTAGAITGYSPIVTTHGRGISESLDPHLARRHVGEDQQQPGADKEHHTAAGSLKNALMCSLR